VSAFHSASETRKDFFGFIGVFQAGFSRLRVEAIQVKVNKPTRRSYAIARQRRQSCFLISQFGPMEQISARPVTQPPPQSNMTVFFSGLFNPRGLKFGPDGNLYVAEGGKPSANNISRRLNVFQSLSGVTVNGYL
jgi:hypothetical protein